MKNFDLRGKRFVFLEFLFKPCNKAAEVRFILEVFINAIDIVIVSDGLQETDFCGSEIFKENCVHLFPQHFLNVLNRLRVVPFKLLDKVADTVVSLLQIVVKKSVFFGLELISLFRKFIPCLLVVGFNVGHEFYWRKILIVFD